MSTDGGGGPVDLSFDQSTKWAEINTKFIGALADARLKDAQAGNIDEQTINQRLLNCTQARSIREYDNQLRRFYADRHFRDMESKRLANLGEALSQYRLGDMMPDVMRYPCWSAYRVFLTKIPGEMFDAWSSTPVPDGTFDDENWVGRTTSGAATAIELPDRRCGSMQLLLAFQALRGSTLIVRMGSPPHVASVKALSMVNGYYAAEIATIEGKLAAIEAKTYDLWKPQDLVKLVAQK